MDWVLGFAKAGAVFGISAIYTAYAVAVILWLGGWGLFPALLPIFLMMAFAFASEG